MLSGAQLSNQTCVNHTDWSFRNPDVGDNDLSRSLRMMLVCDFALATSRSVQGSSQRRQARLDWHHPMATCRNGRLSKLEYIESVRKDDGNYKFEPAKYSVGGYWIKNGTEQVSRRQVGMTLVKTKTGFEYNGPNFPPIDAQVIDAETIRINNDFRLTSDSWRGSSGDVFAPSNPPFWGLHLAFDRCCQQSTCRTSLENTYRNLQNVGPRVFESQSGRRSSNR